mgnify:CR=1 FL=1
MCTYITEKAKITGSGKGPNGWFPITEARVYYDHPFYHPADHTLNIDLINRSIGLDARVAVELTEESAQALVKAINTALKTGEFSHSTD